MPRHAGSGADLPRRPAQQRPNLFLCHNPNQSTGGWSGNAKDFIHSIHGARKRTEPFTWQAGGPDDNFSDVEFPGPLNNCTACHVAGDYDFSSASSAAAVPSMLVSTVAKGKFDRSPAPDLARPWGD